MKKIIPLFMTILGIGLMPQISIAQQIVTDGTTPTIVMPDGRRFDITGGSLSGDGRNLLINCHR